MGGRGEGGVGGEGGVWAFAAGASEGRDGDYKGDALHSEVRRSMWLRGVGSLLGGLWLSGWAVERVKIGFAGYLKCVDCGEGPRDQLVC